MSQHDLDIENDNAAPVRVNINSALVAITTRQSGSTAPPNLQTHMQWADTANGVMWRRISGAWVLESTLATALVSSRASNTVLAMADYQTTILATGTFTQTFAAAATLGSGWWVQYANDGTGTITLDPNGAELIDGSATLALLPGMAVKILCTGTGFKVVGDNRPHYALNLAGDGTDESTKIQAKIDQLPAFGGYLLWPNKEVVCKDIKLQGSSGGKINVVIDGPGNSGVAKAPTGSSKNVFVGINTSGCGVRNLRVIGTRGNGGAETPAPNRGLAAPGMVVVVDDRVEVTVTDTYAGSVISTNRVYRCTAGVTLGATFAAHLASFTLVAEPNLNTVDISFGENNGIYYDNVTDGFVDNVTVENTIYAGFSPGSGPVQTANAGPGTDRIRLTNVRAVGCGNGLSGGKIRDSRISGIDFVNCIHYGGVIDVGGTDVTITGINASGCGNTAMFVYNGARITIGTYMISTCLNGIVIDNGSNFVSIGEGTIDAITNQALMIRNSPYASVGTARLSGNVKGALFEQLYELDIVNLTVDGTTGAGQSGIVMNAVSLAALGLVSGHNNNLHGIELIGCDQVTFSSGCKFFDNNTSANANGAGIHGHDTTNVNLAPGLRSRDTRAGIARRQEYGVRTTGTSSNWKLIYTELAGNITANHSMVGSNTVV